jgi:hypothetical protein
MTGQELKDFFNELTDEQLKLPVLFDTEARTFNYHMALVGAAYCEDEVEMITLHEARYEKLSSEG